MKILEKIQSNQDSLDSMIEYDKARLLGAIKTLEKRVISDSKVLKTKGDSLVSPRVNLKQAHQLHADLIKNFKETYEDTAFRVTKGYNKSAKLIENTYKDMNVSMTFTGLDADIISELQTRSYNEYLAYGKSAQEAISSAMYNTVLTKGSYSDLVSSISATLTGHLSTSGRPMSAYADLWANDGLMNFHQSILTKKGNDAGLNTYLYFGNIMSTTRPFCAARVMNIYTKDEIESWDEESWQGKSGPALTNRGGWNCRHHWQPVKKDWVEDLEEEIEEDDEIQKELKEAREIETEKVVSIPKEDEIGVKTLEYAFVDKGVSYSNNLLPKYGEMRQEFSSIKEASENDIILRNEITDLAIENGTEDRRIETIRFEDLESFQSVVKTESVEEMSKTFDLDKFEDTTPIVMRLPDGTNVLKDGNHRVNAAMLNNVEESNFAVFEIKEPEYQSFDKHLENVDFDWQALDVDPDDVSTIQRDMIKSRFEDAGNEISDERADDIRVSIQEYTSELYSEYGEWARDPEAYEDEREEWQVKVVKDMDKNLREYVNETQPFNQDVELYRGKGELGSLAGISEGDELELNYFSSFSTDEEVAQDLACRGKDPTMMILNKGNETFSASLAEFSESGYEKEVLLSDKNRLVCTNKEVKDGVNYLYFDSVSVEDQVKSLTEEVEEERTDKEEAEKVAEEERLAKEELEAKLEEERLAKEAAEQKAEEEKLAKEEVEKKLEEAERVVKEEAEKIEEEERIAKKEAEKVVKEEKVSIKGVSGELPLC